MKVYVARQPIYNLGKSIFGYELLYRSEDTTLGFSGQVDGDYATKTVLSNALTAFGMDSLTQGRFAFVNFTHSLLMSEVPALLNPKEFIIEILEDTVVDGQLLDRVKELKAQGFSFALDDYIGGAEFDSLLPLVDIIKVDFMLLTPGRRTIIAQKLLLLGKRLLAEKIETEEDFQEARKAGYCFFQGYYFSKPLVLSSNLAGSSNSTCVRILSEVSKPNVDLSRMARIIRTDVNLSYRLLRHVNTVRFYRGFGVTSVQTALLRMGLEEVRRWISFIFLCDFTETDNQETVKLALLRGVFAEQVALSMDLKAESDDAFIMGTFSMIDVIVGGELTGILDSVSISDAVKAALLGQEGILSDILNFVKDYEAGNLNRVLSFMDAHAMDTEKTAQNYLDAVQYADEVFS